MKKSMEITVTSKHASVGAEETADVAGRGEGDEALAGQAPLVQTALLDVADSTTPCRQRDAACRKGDAACRKGDAACRDVPDAGVDPLDDVSALGEGVASGEAAQLAALVDVDGHTRPA